MNPVRTEAGQGAESEMSPSFEGIDSGLVPERARVYFVGALFGRVTGRVVGGYMTRPRVAGRFVGVRRAWHPEERASDSQKIILGSHPTRFATKDGTGNDTPNVARGEGEKIAKIREEMI